jgi:hypothetical protein
MEAMNSKFKKIISHAKANGFLSPIWLMPNSKSNRVQEAFQELEEFLRETYVDGDLNGISLKDINDFAWELKKTYAFEGWDGIAPFLMVIPNEQHRHFDFESFL